MNGTDTTLDIRGLVEQLIQHLDREAQSMVVVAKALKDVQAALLAGDTDQLAEATERQQSVGELCESLRGPRHALRHQIAIRMGTAPEKLTVREIARAVGPPLSEQLALRREKLQVLATEADRLTRGNVAMVSQGLHLFHQLMECLTGQDISAGRYGRQGRPAFST